MLVAYKSHSDLYHGGFLNFLLPTKVFCGKDHWHGHIASIAEIITLTLCPFSKMKLREEFLLHFLNDKKQFLHFALKKCNDFNSSYSLSREIIYSTGFLHLSNLSVWNYAKQ